LNHAPLSELFVEYFRKYSAKIEMVQSSSNGTRRSYLILKTNINKYRETVNLKVKIVFTFSNPPKSVENRLNFCKNEK